MNFRKFSEIPENKDLLNHLEKLGFECMDYSTNSSSMYWHFENKSGDCADALKYYDDEGIQVFSGFEELVIPNDGNVSTIEEANELFFEYKKAALFHSKTNVK